MSHSQLPEDLPQDILRRQCASLIDAVWIIVTAARSFSVTARADPSDATQLLLEGRFPKADQIQLGRAVVFMRNPLLVAIERACVLKRAEFDSAAVAVQKSFRGLAARQQVKSAKRGAARVQSPSEGFALLGRMNCMAWRRAHLNNDARK